MASNNERRKGTVGKLETKEDKQRKTPAPQIDDIYSLSSGLAQIPHEYVFLVGKIGKRSFGSFSLDVLRGPSIDSDQLCELLVFLCSIAMCQCRFWYRQDSERGLHVRLLR